MSKILFAASLSTVRDLRKQKSEKIFNPTFEIAMRIPRIFDFLISLDFSLFLYNFSIFYIFLQFNKSSISAIRSGK